MFISRLLRRGLAVLCVLAIAASASAQLPLLSNYFVRASGVSVGYTTNTSYPGTIRWNPSITNLQLFDGSGWTNISTAAIASSTVSGSAFPLTTNANSALFSITNGGTYGARTGDFWNLYASNVYVRKDLDVDGNTTLDGMTSDGDVVINGDLTVNGDQYVITTINISTTVVMGVTTQFVTETVYSTQVVYQTTIVYTNIITTNTITTYVNIGGTWDASNALWVATPHIYDPATNTGPLRAIGNWDFGAASVFGFANTSNFLSGSQVNAAIISWASTATTSDFPLLTFSTPETDSIFTNWLATTGLTASVAFTNTGDSAGKISHPGGSVIGIGTNIPSAGSVASDEFDYSSTKRTNTVWDDDFDADLITTNDLTDTNAWYVSLKRNGSYWVTNGYLLLTTAQPSTGFGVNVLSKALPNPPYRFVLDLYNPAYSNLQNAGISLMTAHEGGRIMQLGQASTGPGNSQRTVIRYYNTPTSEGNPALYTFISAPTRYQSIENDGTSMFFRVSNNGLSWYVVAGSTVTSHMFGTGMTGTNSPGRIGISWDWSSATAAPINTNAQMWTPVVRDFWRDL